MSDYTSKNKDYFTNIREDIISLIPNNPSQRILEIGSGAGDTLVAIKDRKLANKCVGVELMQVENSNQKNPIIDEFMFANIETDELMFDKQSFDLIICADVLEHLVDPWAIVEKLTPFLKLNGFFIISVPNIREIATLRKIIFLKDFQYDEKGGILDKTHLRFFCKKNAIELMTTNQLKPIGYHPNYSRIPNHKRQLLNKLTLGLFSDLLTSQHLIVSQKIS